MDIIKSYIKKNLKIYLLLIVFIFIFVLIFYLYNLPFEALFYSGSLCFVAALITSIIDFNNYRKSYIYLKHLESNILETEGFNFFDYETTFDEIKKTEQVTKRLELTEGILKDFTNYEVKGYEIHQGISTFDAPLICKNRIFATYIHGIFDNSKFTNDFLNIVRREKNMPEQKEIFSFNEFKEKEYDKLAGLLRKNLDMEEIYKIMGKK